MQEREMEQEPPYVGIDVTKAQVDGLLCPTARGGASPRRTRNPGIGLQTKDHWTDQDSVGKTSGGLELPLVAALATATLPTVVVTPAKFVTLPKKPGLGAVLAHFAAAVRPPVRPLKDTETQVLNSLVTRRRQVVTMLISEKNRPGTAIGASSSTSRPTSPGWSRRWMTLTKV